VAEGFHALGLAGVPVGASPLAVAAIKGVEYACLGGLVGWLGLRSWAAIHHHAAAGLAVGIPFGGALLALSASASPEPLGMGNVVVWAVNELLFPVGCAVILFIAAGVERGPHPGPAPESHSRGAVRRSG
jgi:hypothetical protein